MENNERPTQCKRLYAYLTEHKSITQIEALERLGILRLASRISELKHKYQIGIEKKMVSVTNRWNEKVTVAMYFLSENSPTK